MGNKEKRRKGREHGKKIAESRENTRNFYKICAIYNDKINGKVRDIFYQIFYQKISKQ